jgi:hypothetical protein
MLKVLLGFISLVLQDSWLERAANYKGEKNKNISKVR